MSDWEEYTDDNGIEFFKHKDDPWEIDEEQAIAWLLKNEYVFVNCRSYCHFEWKDKPDGRTTVIYVNTNDFFAWGCADAEDLPEEEILPLYEMIRDKGGFWGVVRWACLLNNEKPQGPVARDMEKAGYWDEEMEKLPENKYDAACRKHFNKGKSDVVC